MRAKELVSCKSSRAENVAHPLRTANPRIEGQCILPHSSHCGHQVTMEPLIEGVQLGHYQLGRLLGFGGMGEVYLARDLALDRNVAIKFVKHSGGASEGSHRTSRAGSAGCGGTRPSLHLHGS